MITSPVAAEGLLRIARAPADDPYWDAFVRKAPGAQHAHLSGWRHVVEDVLGREYIPLVALTEAGEWRGVLPLVRLQTPLLGHALISMPYLNYGGPLGDPVAEEALVEAALAEAGASRAGTLQLRTRRLPAGVPAPGAGDRKVIVLLPLPGDAQQLWHAFPSKLRSQVRRPQKEGMEFGVGPEHLGAFYDVFARNMRDLGTPVYPRAFFEALVATFPETVVAALYLKGVPVAAACGFVWRGEFEITWASTVREYNRLSPNMLLYWSLMENMIGRGIGTFNFGRSTPGATTHRFKQQWGGEDVPLAWCEWPRRDHADAGPGGFARLASAAWQRLPLTVANRLGPVVAPRLPWW